MDTVNSSEFPPGQSVDKALNGAQSLARFARHLARVMSATEQETVWAMTCEFLRDLGFEHAVYGYSPDSWGTKLGAQEDYLVLSTMATDISTKLVEDGHYEQSLTFHWALKNVGVAGFSMSAEACGLAPGFVIDPASREFFLRNGLRTGCSIGFPNERTRGNAVMALFASEDTSQATVDEWLDASRDIIFVVAATAHRCLSTLPYPSSRGRLTARQREVLEWVGEGKTAADIATIMGISSPTVDKHLRLARETLGVDTTAHALIKAAFLNQVFVAHKQDYGNETPKSKYHVRFGPTRN